MKALVLSGGSVKGSFQAGAISEVLKAGFEPDAIYGVSVGSLNGAFLADRASSVQKNGKPDWMAIGQLLEDFWKNEIDSFDKIGEIKSGPTVLFETIFKEFDGLIDTKHLHDLVKNTIREENLRKSPVKFSAGVVNVASGDYMNADLGFPDIVDYIVASTAIPVIMPVSDVNNQPLVDGGLRNVAPLKTAINDGADKIVSIVCQAEKIAAVNLNMENLMELAERYMDIATNEMVNNDLEWADYINQFCPKDGTKVENGPFAGYRYIPIGVIRPAMEPDINLKNFTSEQIAALIELGHFAAREAMKKKVFEEILKTDS